MGNIFTKDMVIHKPEELSPSIVSGFQLRTPTSNEMDTIFKMGEDVWGSGFVEFDYLAACKLSKKYNSGNWHLLLDFNGIPVCSSISYQLPSVSGHETIGIGSIATQMCQRKKGYARQLLTQLTHSYREQQTVDTFILFSDVDSDLYLSAGFLSVGHASNDARMMINAPQSCLSSIIDFIRTHPITYF
jgi:hypothetical protein